MDPLVMMTSLTAFLVTCSLLAGAGRKLDSKKERLDQVRGNRAEAAPEKKKLSGKQFLDSLKKKRAAKASDKQRQTAKTNSKNKVLEQQLQIAELPLNVGQFYLIRLGAAGVMAVIGYIAGGMLKQNQSTTMLIAVAALILGMLMPQKLLESKVRKVKAGYRDALPDIMDLLVVSVEAGLGFDAALLRLYEKDKSPLMEELIRAMQDVQHGMSKKEAYTNMAQRCQVKEITSFLNSMIQAEQMGISIKSVLKTQADNLREDRRQRAEEKALKAPVKMLVPLVIFIFPVIFIVLLGPAVMNIMEVL